ncbi:cyclic AMP-dependent transcription factor ATF-3-like [Octopus sinensis]|uniref:Cyclic AMP-dependent transcription factor ATF-3-like n=1 Tax=Octopus sinensis TaxID=2607531 RepID=A0A6P7SZ86_9MOLL|nr:cyclic AMP-dependent transcription factor ATF-3-like [Octopus sinensis]
MYNSKESFGEMTNLDFCQDLKNYPFVETPEPMKGDVCPENDSYDNVSDNEKDSQLKEAVEKVNETGDMIHIIKQELKCQILYKRFQEGKNAVDTEVKPPIQYELRPEEETRILRRREQNRKAAQRCRLRKKNKMEELEDNQRYMLKEKENYERLISQLQKENNQLRLLVQNYSTYYPTLNWGENASYPCT